MLRSYRSLADLADQSEAQQLTRQTQELFREYQSQAYEVSDIRIGMQGDARAQIAGALSNINGTAGQPVQLKFELLNDRGEVIDDATVSVTAPEQGAAQPFTAMVDVPGGEFAGWRYQLVD
jgi:hypothetical protein